MRWQTISVVAMDRAPSPVQQEVQRRHRVTKKDERCAHKLNLPTPRWNELPQSGSPAGEMTEDR